MDGYYFLSFLPSFLSFFFLKVTTEQVKLANFQGFLLFILLRIVLESPGRRPLCHLQLLEEEPESLSPLLFRTQMWFMVHRACFLRQCHGAFETRAD